MSNEIAVIFVQVFLMAAVTYSIFVFLRKKVIQYPYAKEANETGLRWKIAYETREDRLNGWTAGSYPGDMYVQYYCKECDGRLTPGPSGAGTNQVCEACRLNYGCLPEGLER